MRMRWSQRGSLVAACLESRRRSTGPAGAAGPAVAATEAESRGGLALMGRFSGSALARGAAGPFLQKVDGKQQAEGKDQHHAGHGRGPGVIVLFQFADDDE